MIKHALVVVPATLIDYWERELGMWCPKDKKLKIFKVYGSVKKRHDMIDFMINQKGVAVISPESFRSDLDYLQDKLTWDVMVVDEGHKAKNVATKLRKSLKEF